MEDKADFCNVTEIDHHIEEFILEMNKAKMVLVLDNTKEGVNIKFQKKIRLQHQEELKKSSNTLLSLKDNEN